MKLRGSALQLFRFKGILVRVHWTFLLLVGWVVFAALQEGATPAEAAFQVGLVLTVFTCVLLHEFGHALTALHYGVRARDITLLPIGGVASLERMPEEPRKELLITLAGPAVNLALVLLLGIPFWLYIGTIGLPDPTSAPPTWFTFVGFLVMANGVLFLFNLIPAFPMDGGRVLRALLSLRMPRLKATRVATVVGRVLAVGFVVAALAKGQFIWGLIGVFVFFGAAAEYRQVAVQEAVRGLHVRNVMRSRFWSLPADATLQQATNELLNGPEHDLLVMRPAGPPGLLTRAELITAAQERPPATPLAEIAATTPPAVHPEADVRAVHELLATGTWPLLPVMEGGTVIGVVDLDNLAEHIAVRGLDKG